MSVTEDTGQSHWPCGAAAADSQVTEPPGKGGRAD